MFNPDPKIQSVELPGYLPCLVLDNFLSDPQSLVEFAVRERAAFKMAPHNAFPGLEMFMPPEFSQRIDEFFTLHIRRQLGARRTNKMFSRLSMVTLPPEELRPLQRLCHHDNYAEQPGECFPAMVLYLFDRPELGGTSFYRPRLDPATLAQRQVEWNAMSSDEFSAAIGSPPGYLCASNAYFDLIGTVPAAWNRAIFYDGSIHHSAHLEHPALLTSDPRAGRLTLNGFWQCRQALGAG